MADTDYIPPTGMAVRWMGWKHDDLVGECVGRRILAAKLPQAPQKPTLAAMLTCFEAGLYSDQGGRLLHIDKGVIKYTEGLWTDKVDTLKDKAGRAGLDASGNSIDIITRLAEHYASQQSGGYREPTPSVRSSKSLTLVLYSRLLTILGASSLSFYNPQPRSNTIVSPLLAIEPFNLPYPGAFTAPHRQVVPETVRGQAEPQYAPQTAGAVPSSGMSTFPLPAQGPTSLADQRDPPDQRGTDAAGPSQDPTIRVQSQQTPQMRSGHEEPSYTPPAVPAQGRPSQVPAPVQQVATPAGNRYDASSPPPSLGGVITSLIHHSERTIRLSASQSENLAVTNGLLRSLKKILTEVHIEPADYTRHRGRLLDNSSKIQELHDQKGKRQADLAKGSQERTGLRQKKEAMLQELQDLDRAIRDTDRAVHVMEEELEVLKDEESKIIDNSRDILDQMWQPLDLERLSL
jgi:hypothetical protein